MTTSSFHSKLDVWRWSWRRGREGAPFFFIHLYNLSIERGTSGARFQRIFGRIVVRGVVYFFHNVIISTVKVKHTIRMLTKIVSNEG